MNCIPIVFFVVLVGLVAAQGTGKQGKCPKYHQEIVNDQGQVKCIPLPGSCASSPDFVNIQCLVAPCEFLPTDRCPKIAHCYSDACNACKARYYDDQYNEICKNASG